MGSALPTFLLGINSRTARDSQGKTKCKTCLDKWTLPAAHLVPTLAHCLPPAGQDQVQDVVGQVDRGDS